MPVLPVSQPVFNVPTFPSTTQTTFTINIPAGSYSAATWSVTIGYSTGGNTTDYISTVSESSPSLVVFTHGNGYNLTSTAVNANPTQLADINAAAGATLTCKYTNSTVTEQSVSVTLNLTPSSGSSSGTLANVLSVAQYNQQTDYMAFCYTGSLGDGTTWGSGDSTQAVPTATYTNFSGHVKGSAGDTLITSTDVNLAGLYNINDWIAISTETVNHRVLMTYYNSTTSTSYMVISPALAANTTVTTGSTHYKAPDWGMSAFSRLFENKIYSYSNYTLTTTTLPNVHDLQRYASIQKVVNNCFRKPLLGLKQVCKNSGNYLGVSSITDTNSFGSYYNTGTGGTYTALASPDFALLYLTMFGVWLTPSNVYSPAVESFGTYAAGSSTFTQKMVVNNLYFAGCPVLNLTGLVGGGSSGTTGTIYVTVSGLNANGVYVASDVWTASVNASITSATVVPFTAGSQVKVVQSVNAVTSVPSFVNSGTLNFAGALPTGRTSTLIPNGTTAP